MAKKGKVFEFLTDNGWTFNSYPENNQTVSFHGRCYISVKELDYLGIEGVMKALWNSGLKQGYREGRESTSDDFQKLLKYPNKEHEFQVEVDVERYMR